MSERADMKGVTEKQRRTSKKVGKKVRDRKREQQIHN